MSFLTNLSEYNAFINSKANTVILFTSDSYPPAIHLENVISRWINKYNLKDFVHFVNVDEEEGESIAKAIGINVIPGVLFYSEGRILEAMKGADEVSKLVYMLNKHLKVDEKDIPSQKNGENLVVRTKTNTTSVNNTVNNNDNNTKSFLQVEIDSLVKSKPLFLFIKGTIDSPYCKFSKELLNILSKYSLNTNYVGHVNIFDREDIRSGLKEINEWPTFPQIYINGEFIGGLDILKDMEKNGEFEEELFNACFTKYLLEKNKICLFIKGTPEAPQCGFTMQLMEILKNTKYFEKIKSKCYFHNILSDDFARSGLKKFSDWPTFPQLYVNGEFIGGLDIIRDMEQGGELEGVLMS